MAGCLIIPSSGIPFHLNDQITVRGAAPVYMAGPPSSASGSDIMLVQIRCDLVVLEEMRMPGEDMDIIRADDLFQALSVLGVSSPFIRLVEYRGMYVDKYKCPGFNVTQVVFQPFQLFLSEAFVIFLVFILNSATLL